MRLAGLRLLSWLMLGSLGVGCTSFEEADLTSSSPGGAAGSSGAGQGGNGGGGGVSAGGAGSGGAAAGQGGAGAGGAGASGAAGSSGAAAGAAGAAGAGAAGAGAAGQAGNAGSGQGGSASGDCVNPQECDDKNPCTLDICLLVDGKQLCKSAPLPQGTSCSNGNKCDGDEICNDSSACVATNVPLIDDGIACTLDLCDPATGTINHKGLTECNCDKDADCNDNNSCTFDLCVEGKCTYTAEVAGKDCDDGNLCTESDKCDTGGKCQGSLINVDDANPCTTDTCDSATGNPVHQGNVGQVCSDNNKCTIDDQCDGNGSCVGFEIPTDDSNPCTTDFCDPLTGSVDHKGQSGCAPCAKDADCDDGNSCTVDVCLGGVCSYTDVPVGGSCDDGNKCTTGETCDNSGKCTGTPVVDDDGNPCTKDECDPATGTVPHLPAPGQPCNDGNACILGDICDETGKCVGVLKSIDDGNECTDDACDPTTGNLTHTSIDGCKPCASDADCNDNQSCTNETCDAGKCKYTNSGSGTSCDDGNNCTVNDQCNGSGSCAGTAKNVDDGNPCTSDSCDPATGNPKNTPSSGAACDDGNGCTVGDQCNVGLCVGIAKNIDDGNACTNDACDLATGTISHATINGCKPCTASAECNDNNACTDETCDAGKCKYTNKPNTTSCDDNNKCTTGDKCDGSGACKSGTLTACTTPPGVCYDVGSCNPGDGQCVYPLKANGSTCNDSNACTNNDKCTAGSCAGTLVNGCKTCTTATQATDCVDNNPCTDDLCSAGKCTNPNNTATCDDKNACTSNDKCSGGVCGGTTIGGCKPCVAASDCGDGNLCTDDTCVSGKCSNPNNTVACNDNNACTSSDKCGNGTCAGTLVPGCKTCTTATQATDCNDNNPCTDDLCSSGKCTNPNNVAPCNDGNACTLNDTCSAGTCKPMASKACLSPPNDQCYNGSGTCNTETGNCSYSLLPLNTPCDDGNECTANDKCNASGVCLGKLLACP